MPKPQQIKQLFERFAAVMKANTTGVTTATGIVNFNLEPVAKTLFPVITPLRNSIPRIVDNNGGTGINWKAITAINPGGTPATMREGRRSGYIDQTEADYSVNFATIGLENYITEQAVMAAKGFDDALAIAGDNLLWATMIAEELLDLGGNQSKPFGTAAAPTGTAVAGGSLASGTALYCKVIALTLDGYNRALQNAAVVQTITRTNGDGTSDVINGGCSILSAASATVTPSGSNLAATWKTTAKPGAFGYAWFVGTALGSLAFAGVTSINVFTQIEAASGAQLDGSLTATDYSANPYAYDGLVTIAANAGAYVSLDGATLTADGAGGIVEIDSFLSAFYVSRKVSPTCMWVNPQEANNITKKVLGGGSGSGAYRVTTPGAASVVAGGLVVAYLNKYAVGGATELPIKTHPNLPAGKIFFDCENIPYPLANIPGARRKILRREYWQVLWPQVTMNRQTGTYFDGAIQCYTPFAMGVMDNIGNG
jgi:hypothetical protein